MAHTPGPWKADKGFDDEPDRCFVTQNIQGRPEYVIAVIHNGAPGDWLGTEVENARLIIETSTSLRWFWRVDRA